MMNQPVKGLEEIVTQLKALSDEEATSLLEVS